MTHTRMLLTLLVVALPALRAVAGEITTGTLLREMVDMERLSRFPAPRYKTIQFASYDRRSTGPYEPGWFANADGFGREPIPGFLRTEKEPGEDGVGTYIMVDARGPGAVVRTWTAAIAGTLQLFLDDAQTPVYDGPAAPFLSNPFTAIGGDEAPLGTSGYDQRDAGYFPIPYARRCLMRWIGNTNDVHFYQVQVRSYEAHARVVAFTPEDLKTYAREIREVSAALVHPAREGPAAARVHFRESLDAGQRKTLFETQQAPAAFTNLALHIEAQNVVEALRRTILRITFDGAPNAQVESPLGDFFGAGVGINPYVSVPMTVAPDGTMTCRFVMPFARDARIDAENWTDGPVRVTGSLDVPAYRWDDRSMHFFAHWRVDHGLLAKHGGEIADLPYLCARGTGVYVGTAALLMNPTDVPTPYGGWWGEGDEKIWVDDDIFPSTFGTGSEDYFNYAWSVPDLFAHPYFAQPLTTGPGNRGYVTNNRWHIIDALPFTTSIFFFMELFPHRPTPGLSYARLAYYYAFPKLRDDRVPLRPEIARVPPLPAWLPVASHGAHNAIFFQAEGLAATATGGSIARPEAAMYAGGRALWWQGAGPEDTLTITLPVAEKGRYRMGFTLVNAPVCNHLRVRVNGHPVFRDAGRLIGVFTPHQTMLRNALGDQPHELEAGDHTIEIQTVDAGGTPAAAAVGIDFVWLMKADR